MTRRDDDLSSFRDGPVFQALTGPATETELAGEAEALAAFRAANASRPRRRFVARIGTGGTVAIATLALSGGVAAAYSGELPAPLQHFAHDVAAPLAVPDTAKPKPTPHPSGDSHHRPTLSAGATPSAVAPNAAGTATSSPSQHASATALPGGVTPSPVVTPTTPVLGTTPTPTPTPTSSRKPLLRGGTLTITTSASRVSAGATVTVTGQLDAADSTPVAGRRVALAERLVGQPGWTRVGVAQVTPSTGIVTFTTLALDRNVLLVLRTGRHVHSDIAKVVVVPTIGAMPTPSQTNPGQETVTVTVSGGQAGDLVGLNWFAGKKRHQQAALDATGTATFTVQVPKHRTVTYHVFLRRTRAHSAAAPATFTLSPAQVMPRG